MPLSSFYTHPQMADGHLGKCKDCTKRDVRRDRQMSPTARAYDQQRRVRPEGYASTRRAYNREWRSRDGHLAAHNAVTRAVRDGALTRLPCAECGSPTTHAHHENYSLKLQVLWLCPIHHAAYEGRTRPF
jgi:hypothetical protein